MEPGTDQARTLNALMFSIGFHVSLLASLVWVGTQMKVRLAPTAEPIKVATIEVAGGSHAVPFHLPPNADCGAIAAADSAYRINTETDASRHRPLHPKEATGGGAPATPHTGDGSGMAQS